jgi:AraC-like DNA-binding protein/effector-binding domain-containing protein
MTTDLDDLLPALTALADPSRRVDLAEVGELAGLSPDRARRVVTALLGESPKRFDLRVRVERSAILLTATDARIVDVAMACGFENHETLIRAFKQRFGATPQDWRRRARDAGWTHRLDQVGLVGSTSACITLYNKPIKTAAAARAKERNMSDEATYEITSRTVEAVPVLYQARRVEADAVGAVLAEVLPAVFGYVMEQGLAMAGPPVVRYVETSPAFVSIEGGIPLVDEAPEPPADTGIRAGWLHGGTVAYAQHRGPYETLGQAHAALDRWIDAEGAKSVGPPWEVYITDPAEVPDPADWLTDVFWPIEPA